MTQSRKQFLNTCASAGFGILLPFEPVVNGSGDSQPVIMHSDEGETYWIGMRNSPLTIKIAKDIQGNSSMSFCSEEIEPDEGIPVHKHLNEDELIFLHTGEGILTVGDKEVHVKQGSVAFVPKDAWHAMRNVGKEKLIMVFSYSPAGFEGYFREFGSPVGTSWQPKTPGEYERLNKKWGIVYK